uniref:Uncharacterized protein n=1 Tax=Lutzomyia longipalpis TaxID=7200 RepID=A0A1B0CLU1_LUTLO
MEDSARSKDHRASARGLRASTKRCLISCKSRVVIAHKAGIVAEGSPGAGFTKWAPVGSDWIVFVLGTT